MGFNLGIIGLSNAGASALSDLWDQAMFTHEPWQRGTNTPRAAGVFHADLKRASFVLKSRNMSTSSVWAP